MYVIFYLWGYINVLFYLISIQIEVYHNLLLKNCIFLLITKIYLNVITFTFLLYILKYIEIKISFNLELTSNICLLHSYKEIENSISCCCVRRSWIYSVFNIKPPPLLPDSYFNIHKLVVFPHCEICFL